MYDLDIHRTILNDLSVINHLGVKDLLECMYLFDQYLRKEAILQLHNTFLIDIISQVRTIHNVYLKKIIYTVGWPDNTLHGANTDHQCWLLVQHQDQDIEFQKHCLSLLKQTSNPDHYAYLFDRIAVNTKTPQHYGTQGEYNDGCFVLYVCDAEDCVINKRREDINMNSLSSYKKQCQQLYAHQ